MAQKLKIRVQEQTELNEVLQIRLDKISEQKEEIELQKEQIESQNEQLQTAYQAISFQNHQITASITYAERIQQAMLPDLNDLREVFEDSFVFFKPRDIVSGDFFWFERVIYEEKDLFIIAGADCTGHGVPGAILAMLGSNLLTNIILYRHYFESAEILWRLNKDVKAELHQETRPENNRDGMEIGLCVIDLKTKKMNFSGCGRSLYLFRNNELYLYKGNILTIGGASHSITKKPEQEIIHTHSIDLEVGDCFYLFSDGFPSQFGETDTKKFMNKNFKSLLQQIHQKPMHEQTEILKQTLDNWQGKTHQTDDILVMGFRV